MAKEGILTKIISKGMSEFYPKVEDIGEIRIPMPKINGVKSVDKAAIAALKDMAKAVPWSDK